MCVSHFRSVTHSYGLKVNCCRSECEESEDGADRSAKHRDEDDSQELEASQVSVSVSVCDCNVQ